MARIRTYPNAPSLDLDDQLLGSDGTNGNTENFTLEGLRTFLTDGLGGSLPVEVPLGFAATIKRDGTDVERSLYRVLTVGNPESIDDDGALNGASIFLTGRDAGQFTDQVATSGILTIRDRNDGMLALGYDLASFAGSNITLVIDQTTYTGTITAFLPAKFNTGTAADVSTNSTYTREGMNIWTDWRFTVSLSEDITSITDQTVQSITIASAQRIESQFIGGVRISGDLTVEGTANFQDINVAGTAHFTGNSGGILFGSPAPGVSLTHDGTNVTVSGGGQITNTVINDYVGENRLRVNGEEVRVVRGDETSTNLRGLLTTIRVGDDYWTVPAGDSGILNFFPGVTSSLEGPSAATTTNAFVYAIADGNTFSGATAVAENPEGIAVAANATTATVVNTSGETTQRQIFQTMFENIPTGHVLLFTTGTDEVIPPSEAVPPVYEVVQYDSDTGVFTFGLLGGGALVIATDAVRFPTVESAPSGTAVNLALVGATDGTLYVGSETAQVPTFRGMTFNNPTGTVTEGNVNSISIQPSSAYTVNGAGDIAITLQGAPRFDDMTGPANSDFSAIAGNSYLLLPTANVATITLPLGSAGDFVNISNISRSEQFDGMSADWRIIPAAGERISRLPADEELILDQARLQFQLVYTNDANGWIIV